MRLDRGLHSLHCHDVTAPGGRGFGITYMIHVDRIKEGEEEGA